MTIARTKQITNMTAQGTPLKQADELNYLDSLQTYNNTQQTDKDSRCSKAR